jgi:hypothetical protein
MVLRRIDSRPGDGILYKGCEVQQRRSAFPGVRQYQMFLHCVRADDPNAELRYDYRPALATPPVSRLHTPQR